MATLTVRQVQFNTNLAQFSVAFRPYEFSDDGIVSRKDGMPSKMTSRTPANRSQSQMARFA